ncbi:hypothetical protein J3D48_005285 [Pseudomonas fluorescens]|jgi:hypothetical protein|uniref:hypothetical protein n=1 Tax=Pseudomonas fluorescens TaxID=294 RepID=UPI000F06B6C1|nr:hypothetical protein [Pseudomonas fluorescens]MCP1488972.1 hypothetical protein [Pseudomonas fluorescens]
MNKSNILKQIENFGLVPIVLLLVTSALLISAIWPLGESAAAWVQAIGSIAAIGVAIWIPNRQIAIQEKRASNKNQAMICALDIVASDFIDPLNFFTKSFEGFVNDGWSISSTNFRYYDIEFDRIRASLDDFKTIDMPHPKLTIAIAILKEESRVLHEKCRDLMETFESGRMHNPSTACFLKVYNESDLNRILKAAKNIRRYTAAINSLSKEILEQRYDGRLG